jgi:dCTP diphosphatase
MTGEDALAELREGLRRFAAERDWQQFHAPKNLAIALSVEAAELLEHFQWLTEEASRSLPEADLAKVREELADVLLYLVRLADELGVDLAAAARDKIEINTRKYPVAAARGTSRKSTDL